MEYNCLKEIFEKLRNQCRITLVINLRYNHKNLYSMRTKHARVFFFKILLFNYYFLKFFLKLIKNI
jgi:hypothetical protein